MRRKLGERPATSVRTPTDIMVLVVPLPTNTTTPHLQLFRLKDFSQRMICLKALNQQQPRERLWHRLSRRKVVEVSFDVEGQRRIARRLGRQWKRLHQSARFGRSLQRMSAVDISNEVTCDMIPLCLRSVHFIVIF